MSKKKKIIIMSSLVFLLALTAVLNVLLATNVIASGDSAVTTSNYFTTFRTERTTSRSEELLQLDSVIALYEEDSEKYKEAVDLKLKIVNMMENELMLETLIKSRGFSDAVVSIGMNSDNVNVFVNSYSREPDTAAYKLKGQVPYAEKKRRVKELYSLQQKISAEKLAERVGTALRVLCDGIDYEKNCFVGRAYFQAPEIDGKVYFNADFAEQGKYYEVIIEKSDAYDLYGRTGDYSL